jgi:hypothetical protein
MSNYVKIKAEQVPIGIRFDVPAVNQGQIVEIAYGTFGRYEACDGDLYKRITDRSCGEVEFFKRIDS